MTLHELLDWHYGPDGADRLRGMFADGADPDEPAGPRAEPPLLVAARRRRVEAVIILLEAGASIDATTAGGKTAWAHAARRGFDDVAEVLRARGASTRLDPADRLAVAVVSGRLDDARAILAADPGAVRTGNPEEDRLLADVAGRANREAVAFLIAAGADLAAPGLDTGTPLHQAAWFGQPDNARLLIDAGAPLDLVEPTHGGTPIGWVAHGSRYSGDAEKRQEAYVALTRMLIAAGAGLGLDDDRGGRTYYDLMLLDASPRVRALLEEARPT